MQPGDLKPCPRVATEEMIEAALTQLPHSTKTRITRGLMQRVLIAAYDAAPALPPVDVEALVTQEITTADKDRAMQWLFTHVDENNLLTGEWITGLLEAFARHRAAALQSQAAECARLREENGRMRKALEYLSRMFKDWRSARMALVRETARQALSQEPTP